MISVQKTASLLLLGHSIVTGLAGDRVCHQKVRTQLSSALGQGSTMFQSLNIHYLLNSLVFLNHPLFYLKLLFYLSSSLPSSLVFSPFLYFLPFLLFGGRLLGLSL